MLSFIYASICSTRYKVPGTYGTILKSHESIILKELTLKTVHENTWKIFPQFHEQQMWADSHQKYRYKYYGL